MESLELYSWLQNWISNLYIDQDPEEYHTLSLELHWNSSDNRWKILLLTHSNRYLQRRIEISLGRSHIELYIKNKQCLLESSLTEETSEFHTLEISEVDFIPNFVIPFLHKEEYISLSPEQDPDIKEVCNEVQELPGQGNDHQVN